MGEWAERLNKVNVKKKNTHTSTEKCAKVDQPTNSNRNKYSNGPEIWERLNLINK